LWAIRAVKHMIYQKPKVAAFLKAAKSCTGDHKDASDWRVRKLQAEINDRRGAPSLRLADVSKHLGLTSSHVGKRFKEQTGVTFRSFSLQVRTTYAAQLLRATRLSIKEVAAEVGYKHVSDFDHKFKTVYGLCPKEYRQLCLAANSMK
jgi:AraC-like DNA-binding protein